MLWVSVVAVGTERHDFTREDCLAGNGNSGDKEINGDAEISGCSFGWEHWRGAWSLSGKDELPSGRALQGLLEYPDQVAGKGCTVGAQRGNLA